MFTIVIVRLSFLAETARAEGSTWALGRDSTGVKRPGQGDGSADKSICYVSIRI